MKDHTFSLHLAWESPADSGVTPRDRVWRRHTVSHPEKPTIAGSAAPAFRGENELWNPEELLLAALAQCHMLTFFYLALQADCDVISYTDTPEATLVTHPNGSGEIVEVMLKPVVSIRAGDEASVEAFHQQAHELCFIARSVNFPVRHEATTLTIT
jgi:organic hydroperoxide reductase OsmC/OhrA